MAWLLILAGLLLIVLPPYGDEGAGLALIGTAKKDDEGNLQTVAGGFLARLGFRGIGPLPTYTPNPSIPFFASAPTNPTGLALAVGTPIASAGLSVATGIGSGAAVAGSITTGAASLSAAAPAAGAGTLIGAASVVLAPVAIAYAVLAYQEAQDAARSISRKVSRAGTAAATYNEVSAALQSVHDVPTLAAAMEHVLQSANGEARVGDLLVTIAEQFNGMSFDQPPFQWGLRNSGWEGYILAFADKFGYHPVVYNVERVNSTGELVAATGSIGNPAEGAIAWKRVMEQAGKLIASYLPFIEPAPIWTREDFMRAELDIASPEGIYWGQGGVPAYRDYPNPIVARIAVLYGGVVGVPPEFADQLGREFGVRDEARALFDQVQASFAGFSLAGF